MNEIKRSLAGLALAGGVMLTQPVMAASPAPVDLGSCSNFAILASSTVTTTGGGIINGDVGLYPVGSQQIPPAQINGTIHNGDSIAAQAQLDLTTAYNDAAGRSLNRITVAGNIAPQTLAPGLYWSASSLQITGDLTLDAGGDPNAVWIFQIGSTLTTAAGAADAPHSQVILAGGAQAKNIFWQVGSSATLGTYSVFKGTIMAQASITMGNYSIMEGRALARTGAVTFNGSNGSLPTSTIIKANGAMGNVTVNYPATVSVAVEMYAGAEAGMNADWWVVALANSSWYYLNSSFQWTPFDGNPLNCHPVYQGGLFNLSATEVLNITALPVGLYTFWFAVDQMDGILNVNGPILYDSVNVTVQ